MHRLNALHTTYAWWTDTQEIAFRGFGPKVTSCKVLDYEPPLKQKHTCLTMRLPV